MGQRTNECRGQRLVGINVSNGVTNSGGRCVTCAAAVQERGKCVRAGGGSSVGTSQALSVAVAASRVEPKGANRRKP